MILGLDSSNLGVMHSRFSGGRKAKDAVEDMVAPSQSQDPLCLQQSLHLHSTWRHARQKDTRNMFEMCGGKGEGISYWPWWFQQNPKTIAFNLRCQIRLWLPCCLFSQVFQAQEFSPDCFGSVLHVGGWCATGLYHCLVPGCQRPLQPKVSNTMRSWEAEAELSLKSKANTWTEQNVVLISVNQTIFQEWHQVMQSSNVRRLSVVIRLGS